MNSAKIKERARMLGYGLCYRYDGHVFHPAFKDNKNQWMLVKNWGAKSYKGLLEVSAALDLIEAKASQTVLASDGVDPPLKGG